MLIGDRVRLRAIERGDVPTFVRWMNDPEVRRNLLVFEPISTVAEERWVEGLADRPNDKVLAVEGLVEGRWQHIGNVGLHQIELHHRRAEIGIVIGEKDHWGKGYGTEAMALMMRFAFHELGLHRIELEVFETNHRAIATYRALGFVEEGVRRESIYMQGRFMDAIRMGALRGEFDARFGFGS
jgi:diamine N-acetyltransferase